MSLSIVTAVLNEAQNLTPFLKRVSTLADEIIVVIDYRTTDKSASIAKKFGCRVIYDHGESKQNVFNNKNRGIMSANSSWILVLDVDERPDATLIKEIRDISTGIYTSPATLFQTGFINYEFGKFFLHSDQRKKTFIRLFKKGAFLYHTSQSAEGFDIHSRALGKKVSFPFLLKIPLVRSIVLKRDTNVETLKGRLIHLSHPSIHDFVRKIDLYSSREARILRPQYLDHPVRATLNLFWWPFREFVYKYFLWQLFKEGVHGLIAAQMYSFYHLLIAAKVWSSRYRHLHRRQIKRWEKEFSFTGLNPPA